jgi:predicted permease
MLEVLTTIIPIFLIILTGLVLRGIDFLPGHLLGPLNRLVFYVAIPAMIFQKVAEADFHAHFQPVLLAGTLLPPLVIFALGQATLRATSMSGSESGTFLQSSYHGNLGYIGLAVAYYYLGDQGLTQASILSGFLMLLQNLLSVWVLRPAPGTAGHNRVLTLVKKILVNPVILSALAGIAFSLFRIPLPEIISRSLSILSGMALPLALIVIGASLSVRLIRAHLGQALASGGFKLVLLPFVGYLAYLGLGLDQAVFMPGLVLLAAPSATVTYVMAAEMHGSPDLASATVTLNTMLSALTYTLWLGLL